MGKGKGVLAVIGSAGAIFWPGAFIFGYPGVMGPLWQQRFGVGRGAIGNTLFFVLAAVGCCMFFVGRWQERWGTRKLITIGALLCGLNTFLIAYADCLGLLYLWAFLNGAASFFIYLPGLTTVQRWFPARRGLVSGIVNLVLGYLSDKISRTAGMSVTFLAAGLAYLLLPQVNGLLAAALLAAVIGFAFGTLFSVSAPLTVDCFGLSHFGAIFGLVFTAYGFVAGLLGPSLSGYLLDSTGEIFSPVCIYLGLSALMASFLIRRVKPVIPKPASA